MKALIDMYGKCGALKRTHGAFDEMGERDLIDEMPVGNVENVGLCRDKVYSTCCFFYRMLEKNAVFSITELVV